jgi:hypothetical protein
MDLLDSYRQLIEKVITDYARVPYAHGAIEQEAIFDRASDHYLLMLVGWDYDGRRVHGSLIHVDIIDGKVWIQRDGTEYGVAQELVDAGIPKDRIVLGFKSPELRKHTEFAVA